MKTSALVVIIVLISSSLLAVTNTWEGDTSYSWSTASNWSQGHVPYASEDVVVPSSANYTYYPSITSTDAVCRSVTVQKDGSIYGQLRLSSNGTLTVTYDVTVYGKLEMVNSGCELDVNDDIFWKSGSTENIQSGIIYVNDDWTFEDGTNFTPSSGNTVVFDGSASQSILAQDSNSYFANVIIDNSASTIWLSSSSTYDVHVNNDLTLTNNSRLQVETGTLTIDETLDIENGSKITAEDTGGEMILNSDFTLNGELEIDGGDVLCHGEFELASTGTLTIDGGSFIGDATADKRAYQYLRGTFNLSSGLFELTHNSLSVASTCIDNITGGTIRVGGALSAAYSGTFQPSGGIIEMAGSSGNGIQMHSSNYMYDLVIEDDTWAMTDLTINNDLTINSGYFKVNGHTIDVDENIYVYDQLKMIDSDDIVYAKNINFYTGSSEDITEGTINVGQNFSASGTSVFTPTGGTVVMTTQGGDCHIFMNSGNSFNILHTHDFTTLNSDIDISVNLGIKNDVFQLNGHTVDVTGYVHISGVLRMTNADDVLECQGINWLSGSDDTITAGNIYAEYWTWFSGTNAQLGTGNTAHVVAGISTNDDDAEFGNLIIEPSSSLGENIQSKELDFSKEEFLFSEGSFDFSKESSNSRNDKEWIRSYPRRVAGYCTYLSGVDWFSPNDIIVEGNHTIESGATLNLVGSSNTIYSNSDFILNGELTMGYSGNAVIQNDFNIYGLLTMQNGYNFVNVGHNITWQSGSTGNVTNGIFNIEGSWYFNNGTDAQLSTWNIVNFNGSTTQNIYCYDADASFNSIEVDKTGGNLNIHTSSTQPMRVNGNLDAMNVNSFNVQSGELIVDGTLDIYDGSSMVIGTGGSLIDNTDFILNGELDVGNGDVLINGEFDIYASGILTIDGGTFTRDNAVNINYIYGTLNLAGGEYSIDGSIYIQPGAFTSISGGLIRCRGFQAEQSGTFQPSGSTVEIDISNGVIATIKCSNGNYFHDFKVNCSSGGAKFYTDIIIQNDLDVTDGLLVINGHEVTVLNDLNIYGTINMDDASEVINVGNDINWFAAASRAISDGVFNISGDWYFNDGSDVQLGTGNTVNFVGSGSQLIYNFDADASFNNVTVNKPDITPVWLDNSSTHDVQIDGDLTLTNNSRLQVQSNTLIVDGTIDIENGSKMYLEDVGGELINNSDFTLNGELDIDGGNALFHGEYDQETTGVLTIDSGSLICDGPNSLGTTTCIVRGVFNMSDGLFEISPENLTFGSSCLYNITGGTISCGHVFKVNEGATFEPTGGTVELTYEPAGIFMEMGTGTSLHNLKITGKIYPQTPIHVTNNMTVDRSFYLNDDLLQVDNDLIINGHIRMDSALDLLSAKNVYWNSGSTDNIVAGVIDVSGDWYFNDGTEAQLGTGNTVNFNGSENSHIYCDDADACFGNLIIDKDTSGDRLEIMETARVAGDLDISNGYLLMGDLARLEIGNSLNIENGTKLSTSANDDAPTITKYGVDPYAFNVESGGTISSFSTMFEYMDVNGVNIKPGAIIDGGSLFWDCTFRNGESGGTLLTIDNDQTLELDGVWFYAGTKDATYNVTKNVDTGEITFTNSGGSFNGPDYENDTYNRIHWSGFSAPTVTTDAVTNITSTTATSGGNVTADGGSSVTARGICWSINADPTLADDFTIDGLGIGVFVSSLTGLDPDTHYYVRAYATNAVGTSYGNEVEFTTSTVAPPDPPTNLTIEIVGNDVVLTWDEVTGANSYKIYSSDDPYESHENWNYKDEVTGTTWSETIPEEKKFYYVTAVK